MIKKMLDAKNVICVTVTENSDGSFTSISEQSMAPELNSNNTFKVSWLHECRGLTESVKS